MLNAMGLKAVPIDDIVVPEHRELCAWTVHEMKGAGAPYRGNLSKLSALQIAVEAMVISAYPNDEDPRSSRVVADDIVALVRDVIVYGKEIDPELTPQKVLARQTPNVASDACSACDLEDCPSRISPFAGYTDDDRPTPFDGDYDDGADA